MTCTEIDELAGAIALGAIPEDEWPAVRDHLETCQRGHAAVRQFMSVAALLLEAAPPVEPPARLRDRILAAARAEGGAGGGHSPPDSPPTLTLVQPSVVQADAPHTDAPPPRHPARRARWEYASWAAVAALVVLSLGLTAWNVTLRRDLTGQETRSAVMARALEAVTDGQEVRFDSAQAGAGGVVLRPASGSAVLVFTGLPRVTDRTYQVWALRGGTPVSLGVLTPDVNGRGVLDLEQDLTDVDAVAITVEPGPKGSRIPTTAPILSAPVQS